MKWWNVMPVLLLQFVLVSQSWAENYILAPYSLGTRSLQDEKIAYLWVLPTSYDNDGWELFMNFGGKGKKKAAVAVDMCSSADISIEVDSQMKPAGVTATIERIIVNGGLLADKVVEGKVIFKVPSVEDRDKLNNYIYHQSFQYYEDTGEAYLLERKCRRLFSGGILF